MVTGIQTSAETPQMCGSVTVALPETQETL
jgi:hypothetical protein